jgi:hypothetical protein
MITNIVADFDQKYKTLFEQNGQEPSEMVDFLFWENFPAL